ncbi:MAG: MFS transporter [Acidocella sp.]|nr:MFS transporter [Acidocella sp.]
MFAAFVSAVGSRITVVALPLIAVLLLKASPFEIGVLSAAGFVAFAVAGVGVGAMVDRWSKRRVLVLTNAAAACVLALVPLAGGARFVTLGLLIGVNFIASGLIATEEIAARCAIAALVEPAAAGAVYGRISAAMAMAGMIGPAVAALLIGVFGAPDAIALDALSFAVAGGLMLALPAMVSPPPLAGAPVPLVARLTAGLRLIGDDALLRPMLTVLVLARVLGAMCLALEALFIVRQLGVPPSWFALAFSVGGVGALVGSMLAAGVIKRVRLPMVLGGSLLVAAGARWAMSMLHGAPLLVAIGFGACLVALGVIGALLSVAFQAAIQMRMPPAMMGQAFGAVSTIMGAAMPFGAVAGGFLGSALGVHATLMLASLGYLALAMTLAPMMAGRDVAAEVAD